MIVLAAPVAQGVMNAGGTPYSISNPAEDGGTYSTGELQQTIAASLLRPCGGGGCMFPGAPSAASPQSFSDTDLI